MSIVSRRLVLGSPLGLAAVSLGAASRPTRKLRVVFVGAHPDDVETAAGGAVARYADEGHDVTILVLTRGQAGMRGRPKDEAAALRTAQAEKAAEILKARVRFLGQMDGATELQYETFRAALGEEKPDLVFTWWPINGHRDHRVAFTLVHDAWLRSKGAFTLAYFENTDTQHFWPTHYVDVSDLEARKRDACMVHTWYKDRPDLALWSKVEIRLRSRGMEAGCRLAEGFVLHGRNRAPLPGLEADGE